MPSESRRGREHRSGGGHRSPSRDRHRQQSSSSRSGRGRDDKHRSGGGGSGSRSGGGGRGGPPPAAMGMGGPGGPMPGALPPEFYDHDDDDCCSCLDVNNGVSQMYISAFVTLFLSICGGVAAAAFASQRCCGSTWDNEQVEDVMCAHLFRSCYDVARGALAVGAAAGCCLVIGLILLCIACHCQNQKRQDKKHEQFMLQQDKSEERQVKAEAKAKAKEDARMAKEEKAVERAAADMAAREQELAMKEQEMTQMDDGQGQMMAQMDQYAPTVQATYSAQPAGGQQQYVAYGDAQQPASYAYTTQTYSTAPQVKATYSTGASYPY